MNRFAFAAPPTLEAAFELLRPSHDECEVLAGGTDLLSLMKDFVVAPQQLVSLAKIEALRGIRMEGGALVIGAMATIDELLSHPGIDTGYRALADAARGIGGEQMRSMGTVGGELLQRPRCWYFRRGLGLLAQKDGASRVAAGDHRYHAILGNAGPAKFVHASSLAPALLALGGTVDIARAAGVRQIPVAALFRTPASEGEREHVVAPNEILTAIRIPAPAPASATYEVRHRRGLDWPEVGASANLVMEGGKVRDVRAALGHVAPVPYDVSGAVKGALDGKALDEASATAAATAALAAATPLEGNVHKVELARVALRRALLRAHGQAV
jgi:xanthine dehydrogenase YagS FAD-binding subunit